MIRITAAPLALLLLSACVTTPIRPDATVDLKGRWTIVAVDGEPTGGSRRFNLELNPTYGSAQFGCNAGSGDYSLANGWFLPVEPWIITAAGCPSPKNWQHFERKGFHILAEPLAIERRAGGVRLRNARGSLNLVPAPPVTAAEMQGSWRVESINGVGTPAGEQFRVKVSGGEFDGYFGCNNYAAEFAIENGRYVQGVARMAEKGCELVGPDAPKIPVMTLEKWAFQVLGSRPEVVLKPGGRMALVSENGSIELSR